MIRPRRWVVWLWWRHDDIEEGPYVDGPYEGWTARRVQADVLAELARWRGPRAGESWRCRATLWNR